MIIDLELKEFGNSIGIQNLHLNDQGCIKFELENNRTIYIEKNKNDIFFFVLKPYALAPLPYNLYTKALTMCNEQVSYPFSIQAIAKSDNDIGFFLKVKDENCDQPTLYKIFKFLIKCSESLDN